MNGNYFLLIAGESYYPSARTRDWIKCFETFSEAESCVEPSEESFYNYKILGSRYDWYEIVDLRDWIYNEKEND